MESLPKQFVSAMRVLFDIMDDKRTGYVKLIDIENRWRDDRTKGLPQGVVESLQKVASRDGLLTFDRFCTGLKICLLRNQVQNEPNKVEGPNEHISSTSTGQTNVQEHRPPSSQMINDTTIEHWNSIKNKENLTHHRSENMAHLIGRKDAASQELRHPGPVLTTQDSQRPYGPPKPPRLEKIVLDKKETCNLNGKFINSEDTRFEHSNLPENKLEFEKISRLVEKEGRGLGDGRSAEGQAGLVTRNTRRKEPRRHTLHNGIDYNLLKRMKQIEQEKDVLQQGLTAVEEAREWYLKQLSEVQEKMRSVGRMGAYVEPWNEAQQERLELLRARILELNRQLGALATGWRHGPLSLHMNLALPAAPNAGIATPGHATVLRSQNRMLAEEVNRKNDRILVLEQEKSSLIRELLLQRNRN